MTAQATAPDYAALGRRLLRPDRAGRGAALEAVRGIESPREAWEALAARGVIPVSWVGNPSREFVERGKVTPHPPTVKACVRIARDVPGITTAEALAMESAARMADWGLARPERITWHVRGTRGEMPALYEEYFEQDRASARMFRVVEAWCAARFEEQMLTASEALRDASGDRRRLEDMGQDLADTGWYSMVAQALVYGYVGWQHAARAGGAFPSDADVPASWQGRPFVELPDPLELLIALHETGYLWAGVRDGAVILVAPRK